MGDVARPRLQRTVWSFLLPQIKMPTVPAWASRPSLSSMRAM
jgi:hypothetical protein